jgi:N-acetylneuraminic acid mutarotase
MSARTSFPAGRPVILSPTLRIVVPALLVACVVATGETLVRAQDPALRWGKGAPFPEPEEELYGLEAGGKMYVIGGFGSNGRPAPAMVYEYDPVADRWAKKKPIPVAVHHQAQTEFNGKIYVFGGCMRPSSGPGMNGWEPVDNAWEYDPVADSWRALAPMPGKRCAAIAEEVAGRIYVIGGATIMENSGETALFGNRPARVVGTNQVYDPATNTWANRSPMPTTRNHAFSGAVNGKIYVIGGRLGAAHVTASSNTDVVEEYDPARDAWGAVKARMPTARSGGGWATYDGRIYVSGGEQQSDRWHATFRAFEAYEPATNRWIILPSMPSARHGNAAAFIGNRFHNVSGKPEGGGLPDLGGKATAAHDVLEIPATIGTY